MRPRRPAGIFTTMKTSRDILMAWIDAVNARDLDRVIDLYESDAVLLPTFSSQTIRTREDRHHYFTQLASRPGLHVDLHDRSVHTTPLLGALEVLQGIYRFQFEMEDIPLTFEARFSFVIDPSRDHPILHHHSSKLPRSLS